MRIALFLFLGLIGSFLIHEGLGHLQRYRVDKTYAGQVFGGLVPYDDILDSQRHKGLFNRCTSVVIALSDSASEDPPSRAGRTWGTNYGGNWKKGPSPWFLIDYEPVEGSRPYHGDPMMSCAKKNWGDTLYARVKAAARDPDTWWAETFGTQLYSKRHGLAVLVYWRPL